MPKAKNSSLLTLGQWGKIHWQVLKNPVWIQNILFYKTYHKPVFGISLYYFIIVWFTEDYSWRKAVHSSKFILLFTSKT